MLVDSVLTMEDKAQLIELMYLTGMGRGVLRGHLEEASLPWAVVHDGALKFVNAPSYGVESFNVERVLAVI